MNDCPGPIACEYCNLESWKQCPWYVELQELKQELEDLKASLDEEDELLDWEMEEP